MHAAQTRMCFFTPSTTPRTRRKFGFHRRRRVLFAWLITFPKWGILPHNSHFIAIFVPSILPKNMPNSSFSFYQTLTSLQSSVYSAGFRPNTPGLTFPLEPHMTEAHASGVSISTSDLFRESWRLLRGHARLFVLLMGVAILAQLLAVLLMALVIVPMRPGESLREVWLATDAWRKVAVTVLFLATLAVIYRALAASVFAAAEIRRGRSVSVLQALGHVRSKHLRLFWLILLVSFLAAPTGPLAPVGGLAFAFFCAPALPIAILEDLGAIKALQRAAQLAQGGQARLALVFFLYLALGVAGVFALIVVVMRLQDLVGNAWYVRPFPLLGFWLLLLVPQWYMVTLTVNYFDQRLRKGESSPAPPAQVLPA